MANLVEWITDIAKGERIIAVVIGRRDWEDDYESEKIPNYFEQPKRKILDWETAKKYLDYEFNFENSKYGEPCCNAIYVWTVTRVLFLTHYDGSTTINEIPRNPIDVMPEMYGG